MKYNIKHKKLKQELLELHKGRCSICWQPVTLYEVTIDHIIPTSKGGKDEVWNYAPAHKYCNEFKGSNKEHIVDQLTNLLS